MAKPPPPPPPPSSGGKKGNPYQRYINAHPGLKPWAQAIRQAAVAEGLDPMYFAALVWLESRGRPNAVSSAGAYGLAQIMSSHVGEYAPWLGRRITAADLKNPVTNLRIGAHIFAGALSKYGSYDSAYRNGYNPGYTGVSPFKGLPAAGAAGSVPQSPAQQAQNSAAVASAKQSMNDPWVVVKNGRIKYSNSASPPGNAVTYAGTPLTRSQFLQLWQQRLNPIYEAYTGKVASAQQAANVLRHGWSDYHLQLVLSQTPAFYQSPVWKTNAPAYSAVFHSVYGNNTKADKKLIARAIIQNLSGEAFHEILRQRNDYTSSLEFKQTQGSLRSVYESIYGVGDENAGNAISQAALAGWSPDQFADYLRHLPHYSSTPEYHSKVLSFLGNMGLITGQVATLQPGQAAPLPDQTGGQQLPNDRRVGAATAPNATGGESGFTPALGVPH